MNSNSKKCPVCKGLLENDMLKDTTIDRCHKCGGIWFDEGELASLLSIIDLYNGIKLDEIDIPVKDNSENPQIDLTCPSCRNSSMEPSQLGNIIVDQCPECKGYWLDRGEISGLRLLENHIKANLNLYLRLGS